VIKSKELSKKSYTVLKLSVICMTHSIGVLIGFTYYERRQRVLMTTQVKRNWSFINHSNCNVTDSISTNWKKWYVDWNQ